MAVRNRKIAFVSPHCVLDFTNGAATATRDGLRVLAEQGFDCMTFCGTRLDDPTEGLIQESLFRRKIPYEIRRVRRTDGESGRWGEGGNGPGSCDARLIFLVEGSVPVTMFENCSTRGGWSGPQEINAFLAGCEIFLRKNRPDVVVTYGGDPVSIAVQRLVKRLGIPIVFWLHNFAYGDRSAFEAVDYVIVPSQFSRRYYRERLGLNCHVLPNIVNWEAACVDKLMGRVGDGVMGRVADAQMGRAGDGVMRERMRQRSWKVAQDAKVAGTLRVPSALRPEPPATLPPVFRSWELRADGTRSVPATLYVTFINPHAVKGVYVFARIARELARRRPDIPILVTQGRSRNNALLNPELGLAPHIAGEFCIAATARTSEKIAATRQTESGNEFPHSKFRTADGTRSLPATLGQNITTMPFTPDPAKFYPAVYSVTKLLLMPSLWFESFGLVAAEAMLNGIPVLSSNRGALAETVGGSPRPKVNAQMGRVGDGETSG